MSEPTTLGAPALTPEAPVASLEGEAPRHVNTVDATVGQPLVERVLARKLELEQLLVTVSEHELRQRGEITLALGTIAELLTGDLEHVPQVVAADMNRWLERSKHVAETAVPTGAEHATTAATGTSIAPATESASEAAHEGANDAANGNESAPVMATST